MFAGFGVVGGSGLEDEGLVLDHDGGIEGACVEVVLELVESRLGWFCRGGRGVMLR